MLRRILDSAWFYFAAAGVLVVVGLVTQIEIETPPRPVGGAAEIAALREREDLNVVFVLIDTLRADRLGVYGYHRDTTPNLDYLARTGIRFERVVSQSSWTKTSMASIWTGTYPANHGIVRYNDVLPAEALMPAEIFGGAGFRTVGIWRNGWVAPNFGFDQGFDLYIQPLPGRERQRIQSRHPSGNSLKGTDEDIVTATFEFLDNYRGDRFFLYLHLMDLHQYVYDESSAGFGTSYSDVYDQALLWTDKLLGVLWERFAEEGLLTKTVFLIASDHGEAFQEHGIEGHARNLHGEVVNVPAIIALPFRLEEGIVIRDRVVNVDLWPTMLDLLGLPALQGTDGRSLRDAILAAAQGSPTPAGSRPAIAQLDRRWGNAKESDPLVAVSEGDLRLMWYANRPQRSELYDLSIDPGEQQNVFDASDARAQQMSRVAQEYYEGAESPWGVEAIEVELDDMRLNQLRALGYIIK